MDFAVFGLAVEGEALGFCGIPPQLGFPGGFVMKKKMNKFIFAAQRTPPVPDNELRFFLAQVRQAVISSACATKALRKLKKLGFWLDQSKSGHFALRHPLMVAKIPYGSSPSDRRWAYNFVREVKLACLRNCTNSTHWKTSLGTN